MNVVDVLLTHGYVGAVLEKQAAIKLRREVDPETRRERLKQRRHLRRAVGGPIAEKPAVQGLERLPRGAQKAGRSAAQHAKAAARGMPGWAKLLLGGGATLAAGYGGARMLHD